MNTTIGIGTHFSRTVEAMTLEGIDAWLATKSDTTIIGRCLDPTSCVVSDYLLEHIPDMVFFVVPEHPLRTGTVRAVPLNERNLAIFEETLEKYQGDDPKWMMEHFFHAAHGEEYADLPKDINDMARNFDLIHTSRELVTAKKMRRIVREMMDIKRERGES